MNRVSNVIKEIKKTMKLFNFKKETIDTKYLKKANNFFSSPHNFFFINGAILKKLEILEIDQNLRAENLSISDFCQLANIS